MSALGPHFTGSTPANATTVRESMNHREWTAETFDHTDTLLAVDDHGEWHLGTMIASPTHGEVFESVISYGNEATARKHIQSRDRSTMTAFQRKWFRMGKEVAAAEAAGLDSRVNDLIDQSDDAIDRLKGAKLKEAADYYSRGRNQ